jgi:hypothetical protein
MSRDWVAWIECLVAGHDESIRRSPGRVYLCCNRCGRETAGWSVMAKRSPSVDATSPAPNHHWRRRAVVIDRDGPRKHAA